MSTLDRYVWKLALSRWAVGVLLGIFLLMLGEFIGKMGMYLHVLASPRRWLVVEYFLLCLPQFLLTWLPLSAVAAGMFTAAPMLRQGTLMVLSASGVAPRRALACLLALSIGIGALALALKDQVVPRMLPLTDRLEDRIGNDQDVGDETNRQMHWRSGDCFWSAQSASPAIGLYHQVMVFSVPVDGVSPRMAMAELLSWNDGHWRVTDAVLFQGSQRTKFVNAALEDLGLHLELERYALSQAVKPDAHKTSVDLLRAGEPRSGQLIALRLIHGLLPMLCLMFALPRFVSWEGRLKMGATMVQTLLLALLPIALIGMLGKLQVSSGVDPLLLSGLVVAVTLGFASWRWMRMSL